MVNYDCPRNAEDYIHRMLAARDGFANPANLALAVVGSRFSSHDEADDYTRGGDDDDDHHHHHEDEDDDDDDDDDGDGDGDGDGDDDSDRDDRRK